MKMHINTVAIHLEKWSLPTSVTMVPGEWAEKPGWGGNGVGMGGDRWVLLVEGSSLQTLQCCFITKVVAISHRMWTTLA